MSCGKSTALATAGVSLANLPAAGSTITNAVAIDIARQIAAQTLRAEKAAQREKRAELSKAVGGQVSQIDESVVAQVEAVMVRIALIAQKKKAQHSQTPKLDAIVSKLGGIVEKNVTPKRGRGKSRTAAPADTLDHIDAGNDDDDVDVDRDEVGDE